MADFTNLNKYSRPQTPNVEAPDFETPNVEAPDFDDLNAPEEEEDYSALGMELLAPYAQPEEAQPEQAALPQKLDLYLNSDEAAQQGPEIPNELLERDAYNPIEREDMSLRSEGPSQELLAPYAQPEEALPTEVPQNLDQYLNPENAALIEKYPELGANPEYTDLPVPDTTTEAFEKRLALQERPVVSEEGRNQMLAAARAESGSAAALLSNLKPRRTPTQAPQNLDAKKKFQAIKQSGKLSGDTDSVENSQKDELSIAQEKENNLRLMANLGQAATTIGSAFAGTKLDDSVFKQLAKDADIPVKQLKERIANEGNKADSPMADLYRERAKKVIPGIEANPNFLKMTPNQFIKLGIKIPTNQELTAYQKIMLANTQASRDDRNYLRRIGEERRQRGQEQAFRKDIYRVTKDFEADSEVKKLKDQNIAFGQARDLIKSIESGNEVALGALGTKMARAMGEVGVLTDLDVIRYIQSQSVSRTVKDVFSRKFEGKLSDLTSRDLKQVIAIMKIGSKNNTDRALKKYIDRAHRNFGKPHGMSREKVAYLFGQEVGESIAAPKTKKVAKQPLSQSVTGQQATSKPATQSGYNATQEKAILRFMRQNNTDRAEAIRVINEHKKF